MNNISERDFDYKTIKKLSMQKDYDFALEFIEQTICLKNFL